MCDHWRILSFTCIASPCFFLGSELDTCCLSFNSNVFFQRLSAAGATFQCVGYKKGHGHGRQERVGGYSRRKAMSCRARRPCCWAKPKGQARSGLRQPCLPLPAPPAAAVPGLRRRARGLQAPAPSRPAQAAPSSLPSPSEI